ncbi:sporulation protein YqfD [Haloimpatiens lingqiaonensis]|uniref:sporulation protein YqfD n=1 Tax=Haloimpatiens lingqiaonensis TaxID=1380675 RepID=UPI0014859DAA|nr:sporulation protein YqfD [Haloimpatiens lingqiaonensis]
MNFSKYKRSTMLLEIQCLSPERFINLLWKNNIYVKDIKRMNLTTATMVVNLKDYSKIAEISKRTDTKIKILRRRGIDFLLIRKNKVFAISIGVILFISITYYLSGFIWRVNIETEKYLSPYEIRRLLLTYGIKEGKKKAGIDVHKLEKQILKDNSNVMWVKARIEGVNLNVSIFENQSPPIIVNNEEPCDLVAQRDGEISRIYTKAGTAVVKEGDIVKKGQLLVKGEQGTENVNYQVHAEGKVIAKTFYEKYKEVPIKVKIRERTGNKVEKVYIVIKGKKIYLKNNLNKFSKYDRIVDNKGPLVKEIFYEVKEKEVINKKEEVVKKTVEELAKDIIKNIDKSVKIIDKIVDASSEEDRYVVRLLLVGEENIAVPQKIESDVDKEK